MIKYVSKILLWNSKRLLRKLQKKILDNFLAHPRYAMVAMIILTTKQYNMSSVNHNTIMRHLLPSR